MKGIVVLLTAGLISSMGISAASAEVNCRQVRRYADSGRSPEDISMTMIIDIEVVKKCLAEEQDSEQTPGTKQE